jgi:hypothetical protein
MISPLRIILIVSDSSGHTAVLYFGEKMLSGIVPIFRSRLQPSQKISMTAVVMVRFVLYDVAR